MLFRSLHDVEVRCLPDQIPEFIEVDISGLEIGHSIHVSDLQAPAGVEIETEGERVVCTVLAPTVAALETTAEAPEGAGGEVEPELIRRRAAEGEKEEE